MDNLDGGGTGVELAELLNTDDDGAFLQTPEDTSQEQAATNRELEPVQEYPETGIDLEELLSDRDQRAAIEAMVSLAQTTGEDAIATISNILAPEVMENIMWHAVENSTDVLLADPDVLAEIENRLFNGVSIEHIKELIDAYEDPEDDYYETKEYNQQMRLYEEQQAFQRDQALQEDFFVRPAAEIAKRFDMADEDEILSANLAAQGRFLLDNRDAFEKLRRQVQKGEIATARVHMARLQSKFEAACVKEMSRRAPQGRQQRQTQTPVRTGKTSKGAYDLGSSDFLSDVMRDFRAERQRRGL